MHGKVALISGGAEGIGAAAGRLIVAEGGAVLLADVQTDKAAALAAEMGERAASTALDVRDADAWERAVAEAQERFGKLTTLCNVAGISEPGGLSEVALDSWERTLAINLHGTFLGCRAALPALVASGEPAAIVNVGSMLALRVSGGFAAYCASKAAVTALTKSIALECAGKGWAVRANTVHPGAIRTPMLERYLAAAPDAAAMEAMFTANHPVGRVGEAEEVARAIVFLASDEASFTSGADLPVDGAGAIRE